MLLANLSDSAKYLFTSFICAGFALFDLGGCDKSPMMSYKPYVAAVMQRPLFIHKLRQAREEVDDQQHLGAPGKRMCGGAQGHILTRGLVLSGITEGHLFGTNNTAKS